MLILFDLVFAGLFCALLLTPMVRTFASRLGVMDRPDGRRKLHSRPVPRLGGVSIALAYSLALGLLIVAPYQNVNVDVLQALKGALALAPGAGVIFLTGVWDDLRGLKPWQKLAGQLAGAFLAYLGGFGIHVFRGHPLELWLSLPLTLGWLVLCTNAVNLMDGMDGLATGVGLFASLTMLVAALTHQNFALALVIAPLVGSLLGFLRYNFNPASIFLGDSGSLLVGFLLGCFGALWSQKSATILAMTAPLMALAIPVLEVGLSVVRRFIRNRPIFSADRRHIHHQLLDQGLTPRRAAVLLYAACGLAAGLSLLQDVVHNQFGGVIIVLFCAASWIGVQHLGYAEFEVAGRFLFGGTLRGIIDVQVRLQEFERALSGAQTSTQFWGILTAGCREFGFQGAKLNIQGKTFEQGAARWDGAPCWQLRVPLRERQYANFYRALDSDMHPLVLTMFPQVVERILTSKQELFAAHNQWADQAAPASVAAAIGAEVLAADAQSA
jgi:UDP-GlcNAc:undecaprenyl-phosphate GlcNAc-1-phosphate transferase